MAKKGDTIIKNGRDFTPYLTDDCQTYRPVMKWSENPYNKYTISKTVNKITDTVKNVNYAIVDFMEGVYTLKAKRNFDGIRYCDTIRPNTYISILSFIGTLNVTVKKQDIDTESVWFDYADEINYNGTFGFDRYDDKKLSAFKAKYEKLEIEKSDGSKIDYRVPYVSAWAGEMMEHLKPKMDIMNRN